MTGVVVGIAIAHGIVSVLGGGTPQLVLVVALAMLAALVLGDSGMLVNQAAASAILVIALQRSGVAGERIVDALIGGVCALVMSQLLFPARPLALLGRTNMRCCGDSPMH